MMVPEEVSAIASLSRGETSIPVTFFAVDVPWPGLICTPMKSLAVPVLVMLFSLIVVFFFFCFFFFFFSLRVCLGVLVCVFLGGGCFCFLFFFFLPFVSFP